MGNKLYESSGRCFLNADESSTACASFNVKVYKGEYNAQETWASLEIRDCFGRVDLEFGFGTEEERSERIVKVGRLVDLLGNLAFALGEAPLPDQYEQIAERMPIDEKQDAEE